ncbi:metal ABC transporter solute-binding protein, Zn/Mn family, partial [Tessaracoccus sp.]
MHYTSRIPLLFTLMAAMAAAGCSNATPGGGEGELTVAAAFYPLEFAVHGVAGDNVDVIALTTPGVEAHDVELTPRQVAAVVGADLVVYLAG